MLSWPFGRLHAKSVAYAATSLGAGLINPVFTFYYVKVYLNRFHVTEPWFQVAQIAFMIWNAINDPLFGFFQDNCRHLPGLTSRRHSILYGSPLFTVAFLLTWFPWTDYNAQPAPPAWIAGLQLTVVLCFYDALFTFVLLAQCALLAELSVEQTDRVRLIRYSQAAGLIGSVSVLICEETSNGLEQYGNFQLTCIVLGIAAGACFVYTGLHSETHFDLAGQKSPTRAGALEERGCTSAADGKSEEPSANVWSVLRQARQIFTQSSFISFILMNFCQIYHMTFLSNFTNIIGDTLLGTGILGTAKRLLYGSLFVLPQVILPQRLYFHS